MNLIILSSYFIALGFLIYKRKILWKIFGGLIYGIQYFVKPQILCLALSLIFLFLLGGKAIHLANSGSVIQNELIGPTSLSPIGVIGAQALSQSNNKELNALVRSLSQSGASETEQINAKILKESELYISSMSVSTNQALNFKENPYLVDEVAKWRGRYIHHYSTVLFPVREIQAGNLGYLVTGQYGMIGLLPILLIKNSPFIVYGLMSLISLLVVGLYILYKNRNSFYVLSFAGAILCLIASATSIEALRLNPGFAFFRYAPIVGLLFLFLEQLRGKSKYSYWFWVLLGALNSVQFNILFLIICICYYGAISIKTKSLKKLWILKYPISIFGIVICQSLLIWSQKNALSPPIFSSVGDAPIMLGYSLWILAFPITLFLVKILFERVPVFIKEPFPDECIFAYLVYGFCATYAISFPGSPQHYVGFILMASIGIYILLKDLPKSKLVAMLSIGFLFLPAYYYGYLGIGKKYINPRSDLFEYINKVGASLSFNTAVEISKISKSYDEIIFKYKDLGRIYFISKDKNLIEMYIDKNLEPKIYDVYTNFLDISADSVLTSLKADGVNYVVLQNSALIEFSEAVNKALNTDANRSEFEKHQRILKNMGVLSKNLKSNLLECNSRYCIYKI